MSSAIFVVSCDKSKDILNHFSKGFNCYWEDNDLPIYVGCNNNYNVEGFEHAKFIQAPISDWKTETLNQLNIVKNINPNISNIILVLDDFIFNKKVDVSRLKSVITVVQEKKIKYLRLKRLEDGVFLKFFQFFSKSNLVGQDYYFKIRYSHPYYSSLQIAIWDFDYLIKSLESCTDIWDFELQKSHSIKHYSVVKNLLNYKHIVEKGQWESYAESYCVKYIGFFQKGDRKERLTSLYIRTLFLIKKIKFYMIGYMFSRKFRINK